MRMSPLAVFVRTLMKTSAVFIGATAVLLHPSLEWRSSSRSTAAQQSASQGIDWLGVTAQQAPAEAAIDALVAALKDADAGVKRQAAAALGEIGNTRAVPGLIDALKDSDADVRQRAISALGEIGDVRAVAGIAGALKDPSISIRSHAAMALGELQDAAAVDPLIAAIRRAHPLLT
jgi:HEAT repeat protein